MNKKLVMEFLGTFFLVLTIALSANPIAIGVVLVALVYMGGHLSGSHYNPAVTLSLLLNKKIQFGEAMKYMVAQFIGALVGSAAYFAITEKYFVPAVGTNVGLGSALLVEVLFTFLLCTVILNVAANDKVKGNQYYGLAIGLTLMAAAFSGGNISGGAFNPAVGISPLIFDYSNLSSHLLSLSLYLIGPFAGGLLAGQIYQMMNRK